MNILKAWRATGGVLSIALAFVAAPTIAHHSYAMFDNTKTLTLSGAVMEVQWANPHIWIEVQIPKGPHFGVWSFEGASPLLAKRNGWNRNTLKPGDKITIVTNPLRNGTKGGSLLRFTMADGKTYYGGGRIVESVK